ncbi:MAG: M23 family metallopeptidase, partial [Pygmaiobacter sp.]
GAAGQTSSFVLPLAGQVTAAYSGDELVYSETLGDWRTHNGLDITAASGAEVKAAMAGTVASVKDDPLWGTVVEVKTEELTLRYCGLNSTTKISEGKLVSQGDLLGTLGEIPAETALEPHLHFEVLKNGTLVDPEILMK